MKWLKILGIGIGALLLTAQMATASFTGTAGYKRLLFVPHEEGSESLDEDYLTASTVWNIPVTDKYHVRLAYALSEDQLQSASLGFGGETDKNVTWAVGGEGHWFFDFPTDADDKVLALGVMAAVGFNAPTGTDGESTPVELQFGWARTIRDVKVDKMEAADGYDFASIALVVGFEVRK